MRYFGLVVFTLTGMLALEGSHATLPTTIDLALSQPDATLEGTHQVGNAGNSTCVGDVNGDDWPDVIISACGAAPLGGQRTGEVTVLLGGFPPPAGSIPMSSGNFSRIIGPTDGDPTYSPVACGDFNGDGFDDILWAHPGAPAAESSGRVFMIPGSSNFPELIDLEAPPLGVVTITGHIPNGELGYGLEAGDFSGDGLDDIIMSAIGIPYAEVYVLVGATSFSSTYWTGTSQAGMIRISDVEPYRGTGFSIAAGDLDGDGKDEIALGAPGISHGGELDGRVTILYGVASLSDSLQITDISLRPTIIMPEYVRGTLGQDVAIGDVDDDGIPDVAFSAAAASPPGCTECGVVYVLRNAANLADTVSLATTQPITKLIGSGTSTYYGHRLSLADLDGDGRDDVVVSNRTLLQNQRARTVIAFAEALIVGTMSLASDPSFTRIIEKKIGDRLGSSLASADIDRDGVDDLLVGARAADPPTAWNGGEVYFVRGSLVPSGIGPPGAGVSIRVFPNPFNTEATIEADIRVADVVSVSIFNAKGERTAQLSPSSTERANLLLTWRGVDDKGAALPSGVYFCRIIANGRAFTKKLLLVR